MNTLLIGRIPAYFEVIRTDNQVFPSFQIQTHWLNGLRAISQQVHVFVTSQSFGIPAIIGARFEVWLQKRVPVIYSKWQQVRNKTFRWRIANHVRSYQVIRLIKRHRIDTIIMAGGISELTGRELKYAKKRGIKIYMLHGEDPLVSATSYEKANVALMDWVIVNDPTHAKNWLKIGAHRAKALPYSGIDPNVYKDANQKRTIPLIFIGTLLADRQRLLEKLTGFGIEIYGYIPPAVGLKASLKPYYKGEAWGQKMIDLYAQSQIALNFAPPHMPMGGNLRLFEIPGCGALQIANRCPAEWYQDGKDIVLFSDAKDLQAKVVYYLTHRKERVMIARKGYTKTHQKYTYQKRFSDIISL